MMEGGVHFGHGTRKWNPRMSPYISAKCKEACDLVFDAASRGKQFLIVGTKNKAADSVAWAAIRARCLIDNYLTCKHIWAGIKYMTELPDIVIIVDQQEEYTALRECITLGIPTICLIDTNCDPDLADISIPANDDAISSIRLILTKLVFAICDGRSNYVRNL
ncbi:hypothetical protein RND81_O300900 [Saponaria officinalis]|uniref:Small ribosomal subunit protein uS2c n=1 Tax=Saponaria officinalis TaxID=3572 RepID=A0AAW1GHP3_SAPOF